MSELSRACMNTSKPKQNCTRISTNERKKIIVQTQYLYVDFPFFKLHRYNYRFKGINCFFSLLSSFCTTYIINAICLFCSNGCNTITTTTNNNNRTQITTMKWKMNTQKQQPMVHEIEVRTLFLLISEKKRDLTASKMESSAPNTSFCSFFWWFVHVCMCMRAFFER